MTGNDYRSKVLMQGIATEVLTAAFMVFSHCFISNK